MMTYLQLYYVMCVMFIGTSIVRILWSLNQEHMPLCWLLVDVYDTINYILPYSFCDHKNGIKQAPNLYEDWLVVGYTFSRKLFLSIFIRIRMIHIIFLAIVLCEVDFISSLPFYWDYNILRGLIFTRESQIWLLTSYNP